MPSEIVSKLLRAAVYFPLTAELEGLVIHREDPTGALAVDTAESADVDPVGATMHRVGRAVAGLVGQLIALDHLDDLRAARIRLRIEDVDARGVDPRHHQVAPLDVRMRRVRAQARAAGVPAEVVQLIAGIRHVDLVDELAVVRRVGVDVDNTDGVGLAVVVAVQHRDVCNPLRFRLRGVLGRRIEAGVGCERGHLCCLLLCRNPILPWLRRDGFFGATTLSAPRVLRNLDPIVWITGTADSDATLPYDRASTRTSD